MTQRKKYSGDFKFKIVLEAMRKNNIAQVARNYDVSPGLVSKWKKQLIKRGPSVFTNAPDKQIEKLKREKANLERMVGRKETELNLVKNFSEFYGYQNGS